MAAPPGAGPALPRAGARSGTARLLRVAVCLLWVLPVAGCGGSPPAVRPVPRADLHASVAQFRAEEGTDELTAGLTNDGTRTVHVTRAAIRWSGLRFPAVRLDGGPVPPGETAVFTTSYAAAGCGRAAGGAPQVLATVDGRPTRLALSQDDPTLLRRLHASTCARRRLDAEATLRLVADPAPRTVGGTVVLPATLVLTRRPGTTAPVRLVDLGGSVLVRLSATGGALPATLAPDRDELRLPVRFGSTGRCDAHALGQSQQTFLLSAYLRVPGGPVQREVLDLTRHDLASLQRVIDRSCGTG